MREYEVEITLKEYEGGLSTRKNTQTFPLWKILAIEIGTPILFALIGFAIGKVF